MLITSVFNPPFAARINTGELYVVCDADGRIIARDLEIDEAYEIEQRLNDRSRLRETLAENAELRDILTTIVSKIESGYKGFAVNGELHTTARALLAKRPENE